MNKFADYKQNEKTEVNKALNIANSVDLNREKQKSQRITTFNQLSEKYNVKFDESNYYVPNFNLDYRPELVNYKDANHVRDYLTFEVNKKYFEFCAKNNIKIERFITIPEHFINCINSYVHFNIHKKELKKEVKMFINEYIGKSGKVYDNCYEKYIDNSMNEIRNKQKEGYIGDLLINVMKNNFNANNGELKTGKIMFESVSILHNTYPSKLTACNKEQFQKKINSIKNANIHYNQIYNIRKHILVELLIAKKILSCLPKKYLHKSKIHINDRACKLRGNQKEYIPHYILGQGMFLTSKCGFKDISHEFVHGIEYENWQYSRSISKVVCNLKYEICKGNPATKMSDDSSKYFKPINSDKPYKYDEYMTRMYFNKEIFTPSTEILTRIFEIYLLRNVEFEDNRLINGQTGQPESLGKLMGENFDKLCKLDIRLGALALSFFKGEL